VRRIGTKKNIRNLHFVPPRFRDQLLDAELDLKLLIDLGGVDEDCDVIGVGGSEHVDELVQQTSLEPSAHLEIKTSRQYLGVCNSYRGTTVINTVSQ
jgi:hypothetical protein